MEQHEILLGRIKPSVESSLGITLPTDRHLYVGSPYLDDLAHRHPEQYLHILEEAMATVASPSFVGFSSETMSLTYYKTYYKDGFLVMGFTFLYSGMPRKWSLVRIAKHPSPESQVVEIKKKPVGRAKGKKNK